MTAAPEISVVVPVYNRERLVADCLRSVQSQTFQAWECLVVDDHSTDASLQVGERFAAEDPRFRTWARRGPVKGAAACRNEAAREAAGTHVIFLDSDDLLGASCLAARRQHVQADRDTDLLVFQMEGFADAPGDLGIVWNTDKPEPDLLRFLRLDAPWAVTGPIWRKAAFLKIGGFEESLPSWQDWQVHTCALLEGLRYRKIGGAPDSYFRLSGGDKIAAKTLNLDHLLPKVDYIVRLFERHAATLRADEDLRQAGVGLLWALLIDLEAAGLGGRALSLWGRLHAARFIGRRMWLEGIAALSLHGRPGGGLAWRQVGRWPAAVTRSIDRSTLQAAPVASAQVG